MNQHRFQCHCADYCASSLLLLLLSDILLTVCHHGKLICANVFTSRLLALLFHIIIVVIGSFKNHVQLKAMNA